MALTKVTGQVIKNTTDVTVGVLTVTNTLAVGGTVSIGGTLTYEDVTNVDAVGLITARNGIVVGSGITLSKDGDGFFTGISTFTGNVSVSGANITLQDSGGASDDRLVIGAGSDLSIYHDASDSYLQNATGDLYIQTTGSADDIFISAVDDVQVNTASKTSIKAIGDGAVELYHNNSKKIETSSSGVTISGDNSTGSYIKGVARFTPNDSTTVKVIWDETGFSGAGAFQVKDNVAFAAGDSSDLKIYHNGSGSYIEDSGTGQLSIESNITNILNAAGDEYCARFIEDGAVKLYYNGTQKFETASYGVSTDDLLNFNGTGDKILIADSGKISFGGGGDLDIYHDGTNNNIECTTTGELRFMYQSQYMLRCIPTAAVRIYYANSTKAQTTDTGFMVNGNLELVDNDKLYLGASGDFQMYHDGTDNIFQSSGLKNFIFRPKDTDVGLKIIGDGGVELYHDNSQKATTNSDGFRVSGALQSSSGTGNYYLRTAHTTIQEGGNSVTITLSGLTFSFGVFRIGGYASAGQASVSLHIIFGGYMTHTNNYNATVLANHAQGCSISQTKNNSNYVITITNNANNYDLFCNMMIESANSAFAMALS